METGIWPTKERIEYSTLMLIHSIINSNKEMISQNVFQNRERRECQIHCKKDLKNKREYWNQNRSSWKNEKTNMEKKVKLKIKKE